MHHRRHCPFQVEHSLPNCSVLAGLGSLRCGIAVMTSYVGVLIKPWLSARFETPGFAILSQALIMNEHLLTGIEWLVSASIGSSMPSLFVK